MNINVLNFIKYLENKEFPMENILKKEEEGRSYIQLWQNVGEQPVAVIVSFPDNSKCADIYVVGVANSNDGNEKIYKVLNKINEEYRYAKFYIDEKGLINITYSLPLKNVENETILNFLGLLVKIARDEYSKIVEALK